jgi:hypothetical protein
MLVRLVVLPPVLLTASLGLACGDGTPSTPSPVTSPAAPTAPSPVPDLSALVGVWHVTVRVTEAEGSGCVADTMRSHIAEPKPYTLTIAPTKSAVSVSLKSSSGDRSCTFSPVADSGGFTTYDTGGYYTCEEWYLTFRCFDGTQHSIFSLGEDISGHLSGDGMTGAWDAWWFDGWEDYAGVGMKAQFIAVR